jgi:hypothetical protein
MLDPLRRTIGWMALFTNKNKPLMEAAWKLSEQLGGVPWTT